MKNKLRLMSLISLGLTVTGLTMLVAVKYHREHTSYRLPMPWWMAAELRALYIFVFLLGLAVLISCGAVVIIRCVKRAR